MSTRITAVAIATVAALVLPRLAGADDAEFLEEAVSANLAEVQLGRLAQQKSENDAVRDFAERLVQDHRMSLEKARDLAAEEQVAAPSEPTPEQQQHYDRMSQLSGAEFDREFVNHMVDAHRTNIRKFEEQARSGGDSDVTQFAADTLPTLQQHFRQAQQLQGQELQSRADSQ